MRHVSETDEKGHEFYGNAKSFEELERMNTLQQQKEKEVQNKPLWKRIFQVDEPGDIVSEPQAECISNTSENSGFNFAY